MFPYAYVTDQSKLDEDHLPAIDDFYNDLGDEPCSVERYAIAQSVWDQFGVKTLGEYQSLYLWQVCFYMVTFLHVIN